MNKQELIERMEGLKNIFGNKCEYIEIDAVIKLASELDEPQKVTIPQFVHKYIREARECSWDFQDLFKYIDDEDSKELQKWFYHECNQETLAIAWINGYEVEKEKRYLVKMKGNIYENILVYGFGVERYFFSSRSEGNRRAKHTRKELEDDGFGDIFNSPLFEVEEVEG